MSRILIVDDEPLIAALLADWLGELGHEPIGPSCNIASALAAIEAMPPDAAIIDVSLGAESGFSVAEFLAKSKIPFIFATGYGDGGVIPRFAGTRVLVKPFDFDAVQVAVAEMIDGRTNVQLN
jgi:CheY-like chemotaxis protein